MIVFGGMGVWVEGCSVVGAYYVDMVVEGVNKKRWEGIRRGRMVRN